MILPIFFIKVIEVVEYYETNNNFIALVLFPFPYNTYV